MGILLRKESLISEAKLFANKPKRQFAPGLIKSIHFLTVSDSIKEKRTNWSREDNKRTPSYKMYMFVVKESISFKAQVLNLTKKKKLMRGD